MYMRRQGLSLSLAVTLLCSFMSHASAATKEWPLSKATFAPCPGVGINGSFTAKVTADYDRQPSGYLVKSLSVETHSPSFSTGTPSVSGSLTVGSTNLLLVKPWYSVLTAPGLLYLDMPPNKTPPDPNDHTQKPLTVPNGAKLTLEVTPVVSGPSGTCPLGTLSQDLTF
jgi:hypothetical protein